MIGGCTAWKRFQFAPFPVSGLEVSSNATGSPAPVEAIPEDAFSDYAPSPKPEEIQVVPASPSQTPRAKQSKLPHTPGRRKRGPRSLTLNNGRSHFD